MKTKIEQKRQAERELETAGAERLKTEDRFGDTMTGWWMDGVFLGPLNDPIGCLASLKGG